MNNDFHNHTTKDFRNCQVHRVPGSPLVAWLFFWIYSMKKIDISTPKHPDTFALVDDDYYPIATKFNWSIEWAKYSNTGYVARYKQVDKKTVRIFMHRELMSPADYESVDHINGNGLDNRICNLRICSHQQNLQHRKVNRNSTSGFKGVTQRKGRHKWYARIQASGNRTRLGSFHSPIEAARAYDKAAKELYGEFAWLNFPDE